MKNITPSSTLPQDIKDKYINSIDDPELRDRILNLTDGYYLKTS